MTTASVIEEIAAERARQITEKGWTPTHDAFGGGSHKRPQDWGYRDHYCCQPTDERLTRLVSLGVFRGPHGVDKDGSTPGWVGAFFYLTKDGKDLARALIGQREAA